MASESAPTRRRVLVAGARSGLGLAVALSFLRRGDSVVLNSRNISTDTVEETYRAELATHLEAGTAFLEKGDVVQAETSQALVKTAASRLGGDLDVLVDIVGGLLPRTSPIDVLDITPSVWRATLAMNVDSALYLAQAAHPQLKKTRGNIIFMSSIHSKHPLKGATHYSVSKAALDQLTRSLAIEFGSAGIRVNSINPAVCETPLFKSLGATDEQIQALYDASRAANPLQLLGQPSDVASLAAYLSDNSAARFVTGQNIFLDGGELL